MTSQRGGTMPAAVARSSRQRNSASHQRTQVVVWSWFAMFLYTLWYSPLFLPTEVMVAAFTTTTTSSSTTTSTSTLSFSSMGGASLLRPRRLHERRTYAILQSPKWSDKKDSYTTLAMALNGGGSAGGGREAEIRRKISQLKKEGRLKKRQTSNPIDDELEEDEEEVLTSDVKDYYSAQVLQKLGQKKGKLLGFISEDGVAEEKETKVASSSSVDDIARRGKLGILPTTATSEAASEADPSYVRPEDDGPVPVIDPSLFDLDEDDDEEESLSEEDLVDLVAQRMTEKRAMERLQQEERLQRETRAKLEELEQERQQKQTTSGVGGAWTSSDTDTATEDMYKPKTGSWGAFPRPRDISKAYGGGRRVGPGFSNEEARLKSTEETSQRLQRYREKVGIDVPSEKEFAAQIEEAMQIGQRAMQRGMYATAVSALEKVTKYCSTNSNVGGKVFLELAMAYEAVGKTQEAITVYSALSKSRMEDIKYNAKRLLYGIEAMQFMRDDVGSKEFSRKKVRNTFIETTGFRDIASNFDVVYQTAYVDLEGGFYKRLTESVVRSSREARQILLRATNAGEVSRLRIVQALRSLSRHFDDTLEKEIAQQAIKEQEPVAVIDGKPILQRPSLPANELSFSNNMDEFVLTDAEQMQENLFGEWRLQLLADKQGDGVKFFNNTVSWQRVDMEQKTFSAVTSSGFVTVEQSGGVEFNGKRRILRRTQVQVSGAGGMMAGLFGSTTTGAPGAVRAPQQIVSVDSALLITRGVPSMRKGRQQSLASGNKDGKDYFAVWRRVEPGTYSSSFDLSS